MLVLYGFPPLHNVFYYNMIKYYVRYNHLKQHSNTFMISYHRYLKKAQNLDAKLQAAFEKIEAFNVEEESFGWDSTQYPLRQQVLNTLKPYLSLYEMTVEFNNKYK